MGSRSLTRLRMACVPFSLGLILTTSTTSLADDLEPLLGDPDLSKVNFYLWTPENPVDHQEVQLDLVSLLESNFDPARPTKILSHGWNSHGRGYGQDFAPSSLRSETTTSSRSTGATWRAGSPIQRQRSEQLRWADTLQGWCS